MYKIIEHLYIANGSTALDADVLKQYQIKAIINCTKDWPNQFENDNSMGIEYLRIPIDDPDPALADYLDNALAWIKERIDAGKNVLVHCAAGRSRSCAVAMSYLCAALGISPDEAWDHMCCISNDFVFQDLFRRILEERFHGGKQT